MKFSAGQREAYEHACEVLQQRQEADMSRILGLFAGLGEISEDFDAPLPDENLVTIQVHCTARRDSPAP